MAGHSTYILVLLPYRLLPDLSHLLITVSPKAQLAAPPRARVVTAELEGTE